MLKSIPGDATHLVFDDMRFDSKGLDLTPEQMICLLDVKRSGTIKCRHYDGHIPCLPRIFTTNLNPRSFEREHPFPRGANQEQQNAIKRRHYATEFHSKLLFEPDPETDSEDDDHEDGLPAVPTTPSLW